MKSEGRYVAKTENNHVIYVTDFGADPSGKTDSAEAVIRALEQAKKFRQQDLEKGITLDFPKGVYHFYPDRAEERELYVSNTVGAAPEYKNKKIGILVEDLSHITIEENEIHYSEKNQELYALKDCRNVQIRENKENLTLR